MAQDICIARCQQYVINAHSGVGSLRLAAGEPSFVFVS